MGISVGCQGLSRAVDELFADLKGQCVFNFLDDLVVYSASIEEHARHVREVLRRLQGMGFTLNPEKIVLQATEIRYLGHLLSARGVKILPERVTALRQYPRPKNLRALRRFIGMVGFYARFIPGYANIATVLYKLKKKGGLFDWQERHQTAFESLKSALCEAPVLQILDFDQQFVLVTDASDLAVSAVPHQRLSEGLAPIAFYSRVLTAAERRYSIYEKECLSVLFGCEKCRVYLEHKGFELCCDNLALCWLLKRVKDVEHLGRWILRLAPFRFKVTHTRGGDNVVADALPCMFEASPVEDVEVLCATLLGSLPLVYLSLKEHQDGDSYCQDVLKNIADKLPEAKTFQVHRQMLLYFPKGSWRRKWVLPAMLKSMMLKYYHDAILSAHLGAWKTYHRIIQNFWWPQMRKEIFEYVRKCDLCQQVKPAKNQRIGLHVADPVSQPMKRLFIDFVGPLTRTKRGNLAILVTVDSFSKFVTLYPVHKIAARVVLDCLERNYFPVYRTPKSVVTDNARVFCGKEFKDLCFKWGIQHITTTP